MPDVFWGRNRDRIRCNLMVGREFTAPLGGGHLAKGFIDYKTEVEPGPDERSRQLLLYAHGFSHRHPEYMGRMRSPELLSKPKPRAYPGYVTV